jgi:hypothetical protein
MHDLGELVAAQRVALAGAAADHDAADTARHGMVDLLAQRRIDHIALLVEGHRQRRQDAGERGAKIEAGGTGHEASPKKVARPSWRRPSRNQ